MLNEVRMTFLIIMHNFHFIPRIEQDLSLNNLAAHTKT